MNTINRYNCETWFLLWIDGELSAEELEMVERFIAQNPDLAEELAILQEARLPIDETIIFPNKASLLKQETDAISLANYETYFLLYVDNELNAAEKQATELFVLQHPDLQESFLLLQQTKLVAKTIEFGDKSVLYRKEEKRRPVVFMRWSSMAVAAAMFGLIATLWLVVPQDNLEKINGLSNSRINELKTEPINGLSNSRINGLKNESISKFANPSIRQSSNPQIRKSANPQISELTVKQVNETTASVENTLNNNQQVETVEQTIETITANNINAKLNTVEENKKPEAQQAIFKNNQDQAESTASLMKPAVYKELDTNDEDKSLYIGALEINKDKLRGFLRKAGSVFRSKSKQEEDTRILK